MIVLSAVFLYWYHRQELIPRLIVRLSYFVKSSNVYQLFVHGIARMLFPCYRLIQFLSSIINLFIHVKHLLQLKIYIYPEDIPRSYHIFQCFMYSVINWLYLLRFICWIHQLYSSAFHILHFWFVPFLKIIPKDENKQ